MDDLIHLFKKIYDVQWVVKTFGYVGMTAIVFTETGLLVGFFLPGDSLLFMAGLACVPGGNAVLGHEQLNLPLLMFLLSAAAVAGDTVGYWIGYRAGVKMYEREKTLFFRKDHLLATKAFYEKHGGKTIVYARFVPLIRTFAPVVAGIAQMSYRRFISFNVFGGIGWVITLLLAGYFLGQIPLIQNHVDFTVMLVILVSLLPVIFTVAKAWLTKRRASAHDIEKDAIL
jgi:membrane-associated protein